MKVDVDIDNHGIAVRSHLRTSRRMRFSNFM
uniref:50S ribosomal protein L18 n=1 Tax=Ascaris lumbricoides TaxID=6252 RepID=A0A0M3HK33_ASCLU